MRIAIAGYGLEGQSNYRYFANQGHDMVIADERMELSNLPDGVDTILGPGAFERLNGFDIVVRTAGLAPHKIKTDGEIWSATNEFISKCPAVVIGVTGTKGKGTTSSLIASIVKAAGKTVHLIGNIGSPALDSLGTIKKDDVVIYEMSSFQLWDIKKSPNVAVVLGIEPDHLDVHESFEDYVNAKANIRRLQSEDDVCIYHPTNEYSRQVAFAAGPESQARRYGIAEDGQVYENSGNFCVNGDIICSVSALQIPGQHNIENACAAISAARQFTSDSVAIEQGLREFKGLEHRIKLVHEKNGIRFYDDSYSSAPSASIAAIRSFAEPKIVLLGGYDKGADFTELARCVADDVSVKKVILYGQIRSRIAEALRLAGVEDNRIKQHDSSNFAAIVHYAFTEAQSGDVIILSPGCASFDMFKNFTERGERFKDIVKTL